MNEELLLRTHTSAHQNENIKRSERFCVFADVYRRDEIDATHYPVFHQMEAVSSYTFEQLDHYMARNKVRVQDPGYLIQNRDYKYLAHRSQEENLAYLQLIVEDMKQTHENLIRYLLNDPNLQMRWIEGSFPFTEPSYELEVYFNNQWVEMLGCGEVIRRYTQRRDRPRFQRQPKDNWLGQRHRRRAAGHAPVQDPGHKAVLERGRQVYTAVQREPDLCVRELQQVSELLEGHKLLGELSRFRRASRITTSSTALERWRATCWKK